MLSRRAFDVVTARTPGVQYGPIAGGKPHAPVEQGFG
jgi:hypothetical protein